MLYTVALHGCSKEVSNRGRRTRTMEGSPGGVFTRSFEINHCGKWARTRTLCRRYVARSRNPSRYETAAAAVSYKISRGDRIIVKYLFKVSTACYHLYYAYRNDKNNSNNCYRNDSRRHSGRESRITRSGGSAKKSNKTTTGGRARGPADNDIDLS